MKKILLSLGMISLVLVGRSQAVLNEVYGNPGGGNSEFIELYNSSTTDAVSTDCLTIITYFDDGGTNPASTGWYVIDLPAGSIAANGFYTIAAASPFSVQGTPGVVANANWNALPASGYLKKYTLSGGVYTETSPVSVTDLMEETSGTGFNGQNYFVLLLQNGVVVNGFWGGGTGANLPAGLDAMPDLVLTPTPPGCIVGATYTVDFSTITIMEFFNPAGGSDNGYARKCDGKCGAWDKTSAQVNHTPNTTNAPVGASTCLVGNTAMNTAEFVSCDNPRFVSFDITGLVTGGANETDDFPVQVTVYADFNGNGLREAGEPAINTTPKAIANVAASPDTVQLNPPYHNTDVIVAYRTRRGCFDKVIRVFNNCIILPVNLKSFTAVRNQTNVILKWESTTESNNTGFAVERKTSGGWEQVAFIPSQALNGNSTSLLSYSYIDANAFKGISQYRIRQVDFDNRSTTSEIKAVRGESIKTQLLVYPNPSNNGMVNVVFEDASATRDVSLNDMTGRVVRQMTGITNNNIQFENLMPGVYSLRVIDRGTGEQNVQKIVVNKR